MFVPDFKNAIPGYTGHRPLKEEHNSNVQQHHDARKQIPGKQNKGIEIANVACIILGYGGYIPGIKSENVYGETYGKTTYASSAKVIHRGMD